MPYSSCPFSLSHARMCECMKKSCSGKGGVRRVEEEEVERMEGQEGCQGRIPERTAPDTCIQSSQGVRYIIWSMCSAAIATTTTPEQRFCSPRGLKVGDTKH
eukprot:859011-Rhodomonas_salina.2